MAGFRSLDSPLVHEGNNRQTGYRGIVDSVHQGIFLVHPKDRKEECFTYAVVDDMEEDRGGLGEEGLAKPRDLRADGLANGR